MQAGKDAGLGETVGHIDGFTPAWFTLNPSFYALKNINFHEKTKEGFGAWMGKTV